MPCEEKLRLVRDYLDTATELSEALAELHLRSYGDAEHGRVKHIVAKLGIKVEQARIAFENHVAEHGC